jgi:hypothetical protein
VGVLAHVFEAAGLATVGISLIREQAENVRAPRMLHCQFPLGRPLGIPDDPDFQHDVIRRAFALLARTDVPVLEDHPVTIDDDSDSPASCPLPPRFDHTLHPAVDEALGLRKAYDRQLAKTGRTLVGRVASPDGIPDLIAGFVRLANGETLEAVGLENQLAIAASQDLRAYYEEAAHALVDAVPGARQAESWFFRSTATGSVVRMARDALKASGVERAIWGYLTPGHH